MDYTRAPLSEVIRGPLVRTPQGIACVALSILTILGGLACLAFPQLGTWPPFRFGGFLLIWPLVLFMTFVRFSYNDDFAPSPNATAMVVITGVFPFVGAYIYDIVA